MTCSKALPAQSTGGAPANCSEGAQTRTRASRIESVGASSRVGILLWSLLATFSRQIDVLRPCGCLQGRAPQISLHSTVVTSGWRSAASYAGEVPPSRPCEPASRGTSTLPKELNAALLQAQSTPLQAVLIQQFQCRCERVLRSSMHDAQGRRMHLQPTISAAWDGYSIAAREARSPLRSVWVCNKRG